MRGEFVDGDDRVIPNNITSAGAVELLRRAMAQTKTYDLYLGLGSGLFTATMTQDLLLEPTIGVGGYARQALAWSAGDWPGSGQVNGEFYIESKAIVFTATGIGFDKGITRPALIASAAGVGAGITIHCLGAPLPGPLFITPSTPVESRTFKYRLFAR